MRIKNAIAARWVRRLRGQAVGLARVRATVAVLGALIAGLLCCAPALAAGPRTIAGLRASLNAQLAKAGPRSGAYVVDLGTGQTLYDVRGGMQLMPASLEKLYTTSAALLSLGPNTHLSTDVLGAGRREGATWDGDVYLRGSGDFTYGSATFNRLAYGGGGSAQALALELSNHGITRIQGSVLGDASLFNDGPGKPFSLLLCKKPLFGPGCPYGPAGKFTRPLPDGPRSAVAADRGLVNTTSANRQTHPALFAARQLTRQLRGAGITVTGHPSVGRTPKSAQVLASTSSPSMARLAALTNKPSDNYAAETLFRVLGAHRSGIGSRASGAAAVSRIIARRFKIHPRIYNGSGESRLNRTSPRQLVRLLVGMSKRPVASQFQSSLPVVGRSGTLSDRLRGTVAAGRCQAKDGTLTSPLVGTAAGYCETVGGHTLAFAIMTNGIPITFDRRKNELRGLAFTIEDRMMTAIAGFRAAPKSSALVLSPQPDQVVRGNSVGIRLRVPSGAYTTQARLNGVPIQAGPAQRGSRIRTLNASISQGLRRGVNLLRIRLLHGALTARTTTVRFRVARSGPMVGAGRDRFVVAGQPVSLRGVIATTTKTGLRGAVPASRWRLVSGPRPATGSSRIRFAALTSPGGTTAGFTPTARGRYTLQFTAGNGPTAASDRVTLDVIPDAPMVDVDTMTTQGSTPGITVDGTFYAKPGRQDQPLQVTVFQRNTLRFLYTKAVGDPSTLTAALDGLNDTDLVIVSQHANPEHRIGEGLVNRVLTARLGFPKTDVPLDSGQSVSGIAVPAAPGGKPAPADVNIDRDPSGAGSNGNLGLKGYLARDANLEFTFVPSAQSAFDIQSSPTPACTGTGASTCAGYRVKIQNARTLAVTSDHTYATDSASPGVSRSETQAMIDALTTIAGSDRLVTITSFSSKAPDQSRYLPPIPSRSTSQGGIAMSTMVALANAVASLGGTHNAFNTTALAHGASGTGGLTYALLGWVGAGEGEGIESASGSHGLAAGSPATLSGTLRPDHESNYRPVEGGSDQPGETNELSRLVWSKPSPEESKWPLADNPGAQAAIAYLTSTDKQLGDNARVAYWYGGGDQAKWDAIADVIKDAKRPADATYSQADFDAAQAELVQEMRWVGKVRSFITNLSKPFSELQEDGWGATQKIADDLWADAHKPSGSVTMSWLEFTNLLLEAGSPFTGHVSGAIASFMKIGMWALGDNENGESGYDDFKVEADALGANIVSQAKTSVAALNRMGDIIVSNYAKLKEVGTYANCLPTGDPNACPLEFQSSTATEQERTTIAHRAVTALAYQEFVPLTWQVYQLNGTAHAKPQFKKAPPPVNQYYCDTGYQAFKRYGSDQALASVSVLQDADPAGLNNNYITYVVAEDPGHSEWATAPPEDMLKKMFSPASKSNGPGFGLGIDPVDFYSEAPHHAWWRGTIGNDPCWWGPIFGSGRQSRRSGE